MSNKYSVNTTDSSANEWVLASGGSFLIPEPVVKFFHDGRELKISPNKDEGHYAAIARYVFELNDEIEKLKSDLAKAQAVPEGFVLISAEQMSQWGHMASYAEQYGCPECFEARGYAHSLACEINEFFAIEAQEPAND